MQMNGGTPPSLPNGERPEMPNSEQPPEMPSNNNQTSNE
jgi:hypothetical protein